MYRDTTNVEPEMYDCTGNNWSHWNSNEKLKEKFGNCTKKTFGRFTTKDSYTWNITHNTESTAVWSLKRERWGSLLVQEKYREEMPVTETSISYNNNNNNNNNNNVLFQEQYFEIKELYFSIACWYFAFYCTTDFPRGVPDSWVVGTNHPPL